MSGNLNEFIDEKNDVVLPTKTKPTYKNGGHINSTFEGEKVELMFQYLATEKGHVVSFPFPKPSHSYDCIVDKNNTGELFKVQIKHSKTEDECIIASGTASNKKPYPLDKVDFFAIYFKGSDRWFIVPRSIVGDKLKLRIGKITKYSKYKDNWNFK